MEAIKSSLLVHEIGWAIIHSLWQDALIALLLALSLRLLSGAKPQIRYFLACASLAAMIIFPVLTTGVLHTGQTTYIDADEETLSAAAVNPDLQGERNIKAQPSTGNKNLASSNPGVPETWNLAEKTETLFPWLILFWLIGVTVFTIRLSGGIFYTRNLRKLTTNSPNTKIENLLNELTVQLAIKRKIKIFESALIKVPMTIGWIYPIILIPPSALLGLTPYQLQTIILHELIHIKRYDFLVNFLQSVTETLLFYHPAARWASRKIREEREYICDDLTLVFCQDSMAYARALTLIARFQKQSDELAIAATGGELKTRIFRLVSNSQSPAQIEKSVLRKASAFIVIILFFVIIFGGLQLLFVNNENNNLEKAIAGDLRKLNKEKAENNTSTGEYGDDLSKENLSFRKIAMEALKGHRGSIIVMDPHTGQVFTIVNQDWALRRNWTPASTFKMVTSLAGLEEKQLKESNKGLGYNSSTQTNLTRALAVSNNEYFKSLGKDLGFETLIRYSKQVGFGEKTGINYPGETGGVIPDSVADISRNNWLGATGGEIEISPLQLAVFISAIANGGKIIVPQAANEKVSVIPQVRRNLSISEASIAELKKGLRAVVETGTGKGANKLNYNVAGKTGTVLSKDTKIGLFASYGVSNNSEMVVVVALDGKNESGAAAAQVAGKIYNSI